MGSSNFGVIILWVNKDVGGGAGTDRVFEHDSSSQGSRSLLMTVAGDKDSAAVRESGL